MSTISQTMIGATTAIQSPLMYAPSRLLQRQCACGQHTGSGECTECRQKRKGTLQRVAINTAPTSGVPPIVHDVLNSPGQSLDIGTRTFMESRFGYDFSQVRVHTDERAAASARSVNALAYTVGRDIVFGTRRYTPETGEGRRLLAHELTHVVQQGNNAGDTSTAMRLSSPGDMHELEASTIAADVAEGGFLPSRVAVGSSHVDSLVQRQDAGTGTPAQSTPPSSTWTPDLITITLNSDQPHCFGITTPSDSSPYGDCYANSTIKAPFCQSVRVPFSVDFLVDRANVPRPQPFKSPTVRAQFKFVTTGGNVTKDVSKTDAAPRYVSPNVPLEPNFGHDFPIGTDVSGDLSVRLELHDASGVNLVHAESIHFIVEPCV